MNRFKELKTDDYCAAHHSHNSRGKCPAYHIKACTPRFIFDELAINKNVSYNPECDEVEEFGDVGKFKYLASQFIYVERLACK